MKKVIAYLMVVVLAFSLLASCSAEEKEKETVDIYKGKRCATCGGDAKHSYVTGGISYTAGYYSGGYENAGNGLYRVYFCTPCWNKMPKAESPFG